MNERKLLDVLKKQIGNMSDTLNKAESDNEKMLPTWFSVLYYEADNILMAIESYLRQQEKRGFDIGKAMSEAEKKALPECEKSEKTEVNYENGFGLE